MIKKKILTAVGGAAQANKMKAPRCFKVDYVMLVFHYSDLHLIPYVSHFIPRLSVILYLISLVILFEMITKLSQKN